MSIDDKPFERVEGITATVPPQNPEDLLPALEVTYRNWRGEVSRRKVIPMKPFYGSTEWHPEPGWLMRVWDVEKGAERDYALADADFSNGEVRLSQKILTPKHRLLSELEQALRPFAACVFNDNGDMTTSAPPAEIEPYVVAKVATVSISHAYLSESDPGFTKLIQMASKALAPIGGRVTFTGSGPTLSDVTDIRCQVLIDAYFAHRLVKQTYEELS